MLLPVALPSCWGVDTSAPISPARLAILLQVDLADFWKDCPRGTPIGFFGRYVPLPGVGAGADITRGELTLLAPHAPVVLFQHVRFDHWIASAQQGIDDATHALVYARGNGYAPAVDYPAPSLIKDCEAVGNPGPLCVAATQGFAQTVSTAGFGRAAYQGFDPGLTPDEFAALGCPIASSTPLNRPPTGRGFAYCQVRQVTIDGQAFDVAWARPDLLGDTLVGIADVDPYIVPRSDPAPEPHT